MPYLEKDMTRPQPQVCKILKKLGNDVKENVTINNMLHGMWLNYFQNIWSHVDKSFN
jgi:hypothetical protein